MKRKNSISLYKRNNKLKNQLLKKGYYVQVIGQQDEIEYLIVSCAEPRNKD